MAIIDLQEVIPIEVLRVNPLDLSLATGLLSDTVPGVEAGSIDNDMHFFGAK